MRRSLIGPAVLAFLALCLICLPLLRSDALGQRHRHRRGARPTRQGSFSGAPIVPGSLSDEYRSRRRSRRSSLIGAGAGAAGGTAYHKPRHNRRRHRH